jgi:hypothetical protein
MVWLDTVTQSVGAGARDFVCMLSLRRSRWILLLCFFACGWQSTIRSQESDSSNAKNSNEVSKDSKRSVLIVVGAPGEPTYGEAFRTWAETWKKAFDTKCDFEYIDGSLDSAAGPSTDRSKIMDWISRADNAHEKWMIFIGHGTSDKDGHKINLRGPDLSAEELSKELNAQSGKRWVIVNCASSSGPFINALSGADRVIITATKSGAEQNYARFGEYMAQSLSDPTADLDHDNCISILECFLAASNRVAQFYANEDRLASEQSLLDDNGDKKGTPAAFYRGARPVKAPADGLKLDGSLANRFIVTRFEGEPELSDDQRTKVDALEMKIETLRTKKKEMPEDEYYRELESILFEIIALRRAPVSNR